MVPRFLFAGLVAWAALAAPAQAPEAPPKKPDAAPEKSEAPPEKPAYEPTSRYVPRDVEGWTVLVHQRLLEGEKKDLGAETLKVLAAHLHLVNRMVPAKALERLRQVRIWVEADSKDVVCMCYHPSREWLADHGFNPEKAKGVELGGPANFLSWTKHQFAMVLHELAHGYHHQVLGYDRADVKEAYERAKESKSYDDVLYFDGTRKRAYAMNNDQEYFAETTEAFFGTNDMYPFVRAELKVHDPGMYDVLRKAWGVE